MNLIYKFINLFSCCYRRKDLITICQEIEDMSGEEIAYIVRHINLVNMTRNRFKNNKTC